MVLAPASAAHAHAESGVSRALGQPLVRFGIVRSYANSLPCGTGEAGAGQPATPKACGPSAIMRREGDILSFRSLYLDIGEIDVQTDGEHVCQPPSCTLDLSEPPGKAHNVPCKLLMQKAAMPVCPGSGGCCWLSCWWVQA